MGTSQMLGEDIDSWETMMFLYNSALKEVGTKLEILNDEFVHTVYRISDVSCSYG